MPPSKTVNQTVESMKFTLNPFKNVFVKMDFTSLKEAAELVNLPMDTSMTQPSKDVSGCADRMKFSSTNNVFAKRDITE